VKVSTFFTRVDLVIAQSIPTHVTLTAVTAQLIPETRVMHREFSIASNYRCSSDTAIVLVPNRGSTSESVWWHICISKPFDLRWAIFFLLYHVANNNAMRAIFFYLFYLFLTFFQSLLRRYASAVLGCFRCGSAPAPHPCRE
jgi:hypothetical protein